MAGILTLPLGGRTFAVRPLTLGQIRDLSIGLRSDGPADADESPAGTERRAYDEMVAAIVTGVRRDAADVTADAIYDMEITLDELRAAYRAVLVHSGLVPSGEAPAAPSGGATSTGS